MMMRERVRQIMRSEGVTITKVAEMSGYNRNTISNFLNNVNGTTVDTLEDVLYAIGYKLEIVKMEDDDVDI